MCRSLKGQGATVFLALVIVVAVVFGAVIAKAFVGIRGVQIQTIQEMYILAGDEGAKMISLLSSQTSELRHMEIAGDMFAENHMQHIPGRVKLLEKTAKASVSYLAVSNNTGNEIAQFGTAPQDRKDEVEMEIPLPGAGKAKEGAKGLVKVGR